MEFTFTKDNFEKETASGVVLVDFFATWCGPCQAQAPIIHELAKEFEGKAKIGKLNVDENPDIASKFDVLSIPTLILFKDGKEAEKVVGLQQKDQLKAKIQGLL